LALAQGGVRVSSSVRTGARIFEAGLKGVQAGAQASAMTKGSSRGTRGSVGGGGGQPPSGSTYRDRFYKQYPNAPRDYKIHHRIPQKARDMGIFPAKVVDSVDNLRAVPENIHNQISTEWTHFWRRYSNSKPSTGQVEQFAKQLDQKYGQYFWQP
jgi:hypothetical protein